MHLCGVDPLGNIVGFIHAVGSSAKLTDVDAYVHMPQMHGISLFTSSHEDSKYKRLCLGISTCNVFVFDISLCKKL